MTKGRKRLAVSTVVAVLMGATAAFAFWSSTGSGTGAAGTGKVTQAVTIQQVGAGYNSLISSNSPDPYIQDQCFSCAGISELGDNVTLANPGAQQLVNVIVAFRNWNANAITGLPITLTINNGIAGPVTDTEHANFPPAVTAGSNPSVTNVTFNFQNQGAFVQQSFTYGITFDPNFDSGAANGLNVALSSSYNNDTVGSETNPGTLWVNASSGPGIAGNFPPCTTPGTGFAQVITNCGSASLSNPGAYGTTAQVKAGNADVPAVQVNVVGGVVTGLYPGGPAQPVNFAITNPNSSTVHVGTVTTALGALSNAGTNPADPACTAADYTLGNATVTVGQDVAQGTSVFPATGTSISMPNLATNQDNCQGADIGLTFTSN